MKRREFVSGSASLAVGATLGLRPFLLAEQAPAESAAFPSSVAGVRLVDSEIAKKATELSRTVSPPYLFNHAVRTFLFGALVGKALSLKFDEEVLYLASILHDLGLTDRFEGKLPFEIQGAEASRQFLEERGYAKEKAAMVWDGIAMHASLIGHFKPPEIRLVGEGAGADAVAPDFSQISKAQVAEVVKAFPRLQFKTAFLKTCADVVRKYPGGATRSFMRDIGERYVPEFHPKNFCDLVAEGPFSE
jgi:HD domain-containing protein